MLMVRRGGLTRTVGPQDPGLPTYFPALSPCGSSVWWNETGGVFLKTIVLVLLALGVTGSAMAVPSTVPEIDPGAAVNALALLGGALLVIRGRRRR